MDKRLAIVIPVWNNWNFTKRALQSLSKLPNDHLIIVVDNSSSDETKNLQSSDKVQVIHNKKNLWFAGGCNIGYTRAVELNYPNVMFLNNDIKIMKDFDTWTNPIIEQIEKEECIAGPTVGCLDKNLNFVCEASKFPTKGVYYMSGWNISASVTTWEKLKPLDHDGPWNTIFGFYHEDTDLGLTAQSKGIKLRVVSVPVKHFGKASSKKLGVNELFTKSRKIFIKTWMGKV